MTRFALCGALLALLAACNPNPYYRSVGSAPVGTDASTGLPALSSRSVGPGGINRDYYIGGGGAFPETQGSGRR
jgi:hypothetical protein